MPYVMMVYRALIQETTGVILNYMMQGREVSTPLDLMYDMPPAVKFIPHKKWAWQLKETLEEDHRFVRENINTTMVRVKRYHDQKLSWQVFMVDNSLYVYFPLRKLGRSRWQGPLKKTAK